MVGSGFGTVKPIGSFWLATVPMVRPSWLSAAVSTVRRRLRSTRPRIAGLISAWELGKAGYVSLQTGKWWGGNFSTGGFTDCALRHGAARVYAIDVGHGQLHPSLHDDPESPSQPSRELSFLFLQKI